MDDDKLFFEQAMNGVKPLSQKYQNKLSLKTKDTRLVPVPQRKTQGHVCTSPESIYQGTVCVESSLSYQSAIVTRRQFSKLRQGKIAYQSFLDLHQKTCWEAEKSIKQFILSNYEYHHNCCLIIHGKGQGLLKNVTDKVLRSIELVIAFHSAKPSHGGTGAVYVLLK